MAKRSLGEILIVFFCGTFVSMLQRWQSSICCLIITSLPDAGVGLWDVTLSMEGFFFCRGCIPHHDYMGPILMVSKLAVLQVLKIMGANALSH